MGELKTRFIIKSLAGAVCGMLISAVLCSSDNVVEMIAENRLWLLFQFGGSGLMGAICLGSNVVYEIEHWSIRKATLIHYAICLVTFSTASLLLQWFPRRILLIVLLIYTAIYGMIWLLHYKLWSREVRRMNRELSQINRSEQGDGQK